MADFNVFSQYAPAGDQPEAIRRLTEGLKQGVPFQTLLGVTGSGKTFTLAKVLEQMGTRPALVLSHNKTLAAQLYSEFKAFLPENAVEYFISYYDYYLPESYIPQTDTYIAKDASINENIERLRMSATASLLERKDTLVVASVSCIYGLTSPIDYDQMSIRLKVGQELNREDFLRLLVGIQYIRNDYSPERGEFRARGDNIDIFLSQKNEFLRVEFWGDEIDSLSFGDVQNGKIKRRAESALIFPAKHFVMPQEQIEMAIHGILEEMKECVKNFEEQGKIVEAQRLFQRVNYDVEMMREIGYCSGIENYSRHLAGRAPGSRPYCLLDFFPKDYLLFIDESHVTLPQIQAMYKADRSRKQMLVDYGFRLPSALDNRPLKFEEFMKLLGATVFVSATPGDFELEKSGIHVAEQIVRPTGLLDPPVEVRPLDTQIDDVIAEIRETSAKGMRSMVATLTKKSAERLADYLTELGLRVKYLHSGIDAIERVRILSELRNGDFDCIVGINLLREGIDMPELQLVAILDADKEGFLRSTRSLIQVAGRAARNAQGRVILYADKITDSMKALIQTTENRRKKQSDYNKKHGIVPKTIVKPVRETITDVLGISNKTGAFLAGDQTRLQVLRNQVDYQNQKAVLREDSLTYFTGKGKDQGKKNDANAGSKNRKGKSSRRQELSRQEADAVMAAAGFASPDEIIEALEQDMLKAAENLEFERAAELRDRIRSLSDLWGKEEE